MSSFLNGACFFHFQPPYRNQNRSHDHAQDPVINSTKTLHPLLLQFPNPDGRLQMCSARLNRAMTIWTGESGLDYRFLRQGPARIKNIICQQWPHQSHQEPPLPRTKKLRWIQFMTNPKHSWDLVRLLLGMCNYCLYLKHDKYLKPDSRPKRYDISTMLFVDVNNLLTRHG